jgi:hypothetical protein
VTSEPENQDSFEDEDKTITEIGRELLKYLHRRLEELGTNQASYRQARMELLRQLESTRERKRFNWGFEAVFTQEIHILEELGLVAIKYGSGAIMAGRSNPNQIYNLSLTSDGKDTARVILEREDRARSDTARLEESKQEEMELADEEDDDLDETDQEPEEAPESTVVDKDDIPAGAKEKETEPPPSPGSEYAHDEDHEDESEKAGAD